MDANNIVWQLFVFHLRSATWSLKLSLCDSKRFKFSSSSYFVNCVFLEFIIKFLTLDDTFKMLVKPKIMLIQGMCDSQRQFQDMHHSVNWVLGSIPWQQIFNIFPKKKQLKTKTLKICLVGYKYSTRQSFNVLLFNCFFWIRWFSIVSWKSAVTGLGQNISNQLFSTIYKLLKRACLVSKDREHGSCINKHVYHSFLPSAYSNTYHNLRPHVKCLHI